MCPSKPAILTSLVSSPGSASVSSNTGRAGNEGSRTGIRSVSQGTHGIMPFIPFAELLGSIFISRLFLLIRFSSVPEKGHQAKTSPDSTSTQENIQPHSTRTGANSGSSNTGQVNLNRRPQLTKVQILLLASKAELCMRPQLSRD